MTIDSRIFRNALGCFPTGITVITTCDAKGAPVGVTVSSFTSVSLDPPLILFCLDNKTQRLEAFRSNQHFAVNVLRHSQIELSNRFSGRDEQLWREVEFRSGEQGVPLIEGCLACFECVREII
ncbi:MAG TPA: flavin reductase family protein, partial [Rhodospirillaceae bacterium]|nr:flavin reductase family protein [Rhodospirillaceae bacterium]